LFSAEITKQLIFNAENVLMAELLHNLVCL